MRRVLARSRVQNNSHGLESDGKYRPDPRATMGIENGCKWNPQWTLDQLEQIDTPHGTKVGAYHADHIKHGTVHENFGEDLQWVIQRAHQQITDDKLAAEEKQRRKDEKERREAKKRKAA